MGASASPVQPEPWDSTDKHKVMWLVPATLVLAAIKGKGKGASDKGSKGNTGRGSMGHKGSQGGKGSSGGGCAQCRVSVAVWLAACRLDCPAKHLWKVACQV